MPDDRIVVEPEQVARLVASQFPQWAHLPVRRVEPGGWDNRTFHLGDQMSVRMPSHLRYIEQVAKEHHWLPVLAGQLPLPIPAPIALGQPGEGFPWPWSIYRWLPGEPASQAEIWDTTQFAVDLAEFLLALQRIDPTGGPAAGEHNFHRGGDLRVYDDETRRSIAALADDLDLPRVTAVWDRAISTSWQGAPVWIHGDVAVGNLLVEAGRLSAVIDFGTSAIGDPACDLVMAWTYFSGESRRAFRAALPLDDATWDRAQGWALWKALITITRNQPQFAWARATINAILGDAEALPE